MSFDEQITDSPIKRVAAEIPPGVGLPAADDIFTDNVRWGDLDDWNRTALRIHEQQGGHYRIESSTLTSCASCRSDRS